MDEQLLRKVRCKVRNPCKKGEYDTSLGHLFFVTNHSKGYWRDYERMLYPSYWFEPVVWNSPNETPPERNIRYAEYSITVLITDGKCVGEGFYNYDLKQWHWNLYINIKCVMGWQYMPALPKSKPV